MKLLTWRSLSALLLLPSATAWPCSIASLLGSTRPEDGQRAVIRNSQLFLSLSYMDPAGLSAELEDPRGLRPIPLTVEAVSPDLAVLRLPPLDPNIEYVAVINPQWGGSAKRISFLSIDQEDQQPPRFEGQLELETRAVESLPPCGEVSGYQITLSFPAAQDEHLAAYTLYERGAEGAVALTSHLALPGEQSPLSLSTFSTEAPEGRCFFVEAIDLAGHRTTLEDSCQQSPPPPPPQEPPEQPPVGPPEQPPSDELETEEASCGCTSTGSSRAPLAWVLLLGLLGRRPVRGPRPQKRIFRKPKPPLAR